MAYPNRSNFVSPEPLSAWWRVQESGHTIICSSTGYELAYAARSLVNQNAQGRTIRDWRGRAISRLTGPVSFSADLQRFIWSTTNSVAGLSAGAAYRALANEIRREAEEHLFGIETMRALIRLILVGGRYQLRIPENRTDLQNIRSGFALSTIDIPENWLPPITGEALTAGSGTAANSVCLFVDPTQPPATPQTPTQQIVGSAPAPSALPPVDTTPIKPVDLPPVVADIDKYDPMEEEKLLVVSMPGEITEGSATLPPPPPEMRFLVQTTSSDNTMLYVGLAALGVAILYLATQETKTEQVQKRTGPALPPSTPAARTNPRRGRKPRRNRRR